MKIGRYSLIEKIGDGPCSSVYKAEDRTLKDRTVAIKIWHAPLQDQGTYNAFLQDIRPLVTLRHAHILPIFEANTDDDILYFVSMYAPGRSIKNLQQRHPRRIIPVDHVVSIITQIGKALHYAYEANIHHSLLPENILFGEGYEAFLSDFNILTQLARIGIKRDDSFGYSHYPWLRYLDDFGRDRANQYKLGHLAYELCTGKKPVYSGDWPIAPFVYNRQIPRAFEQTIQCALRLRTSAYPNTSAFLEALNGSNVYDDLVLGEPSRVFFDEEKEHRGSVEVDVSEEELTKNVEEFLADGKNYYELRHYEKALLMFENALCLTSKDARIHIRIGKALLKLERYKESLKSFEQAIQLQPKHPIALVGKGNTLLALGNNALALETFEKALQLNPRLVEAHAGKGHALFTLNHSKGALKSYRQAIELQTDDVNCYINSAEILTALNDYVEASQLLEHALRLEPELVSGYLRLGNAYIVLERYEDALLAYERVVTLDTTNTLAYMKMGDIYSTSQIHEHASDAYEKALQPLQDERDCELFWSLVNSALPTFFRPPYVQFELLRQLIIKTPQDARVKIALTEINALYEHLFEPQNLPTEKLQLYVQKLAMMLESFPEESRPEALLLVTGGDDIRTVQMLIALAPFAIAGLGTLAHQLTLRLTPEPRADDLFVRFYHVLDSYGVPFEDSDWLFCQELMAERLYVQAKSILSDLVKRRPAPDILWLLAEALLKLGESPQEQIETLRHFISVVSPADKRYGYAWKGIGILYEEQLQNGIEAIKAYEQAAKHGLRIQQLEDFYAGRWDAIPVLHSHPDYAFPPVIVIDLESEYRPEAPSDPLIFEVGAVCVKGSTELKPFHDLIRCDARKVAHRQHEAKPLEDVVKALCDFIEQSQQGVENAIIVGHNLQEFDAPHLRKMGLSIEDDQIIDTLTFARLLYPDSLQHNLSLLCATHEIPLEEAHQALPDARACAHLLYALGNELVGRGEHLLAGFRAFVPPGSVFDRVVLQPRQQEACSDYPWELNPEPSPAHVLRMVKDSSPSTELLQAIHAQDDALIERFDPEAAYGGYLPTARKTVVTVATRTRLEQLLVSANERTDYFVLPDPRTLLCPCRLRECIEREEASQVQLALFCLYQASHNHDAATLYPLRLPLKPVEPTSIDKEAKSSKCNIDTMLYRLRQILLKACCAGEWGHAECCSATLAANKAAETSLLVLATHESFLHQEQQSAGDLLIVDDLDDLQMHFAEYLAEQVTHQEVLHWSEDIHHLLTETITSHLQEHGGRGAFHERVPFSRFMPYLTQPHGDGEKSLLTLLRERGDSGKAVAGRLESFCQDCLQNVVEPGRVHAYWLDLHVAPEQEGSNTTLDTWSICGLNRDLRRAFDEIYWKPYRQHILCGTALKLGARETQFIRRFFGIPAHVPFAADQRPPHQVFIPTEKTIRPSNFLGRRPWAESAGAFVYQLAHATRGTLLVSLASPAVTEALAKALHAQEKLLNRRVVSPHLDWTTAKMAERLADDTFPTIALISPYLRKVALNDRVGIELTGPLRFLNQRDPLVEAQMRAYTVQSSKDGHGPFTSYLLPQALLELKARMASRAGLHIILDSALHNAVYRDEVFSLFKDLEILDTIPDLQAGRQVPEEFVYLFADELDRQGLSSSLDVSNDELYATLHTYWQATDSFKTSPLDQKEVVRGVLDGKDQLVIAATGGGKSLCFQLPAILLAQDVVPKVTLVISPLIALMRDQIASLRRRGVFSVVVLDSMLSTIEREHYLQGIKRGDYSIIYIAPEQVHSAALLRALRRRKIGLIAIDEAHCVSQWGHDFRTAYFALRRWIEKDICEGRRRDFPLLAVTATARKGYEAAEGGNPEKSTIEDIVEKLGLRLTPYEVKLTSPERPELEFRVEQIALPCPNCQSLSTRGPGEVRCEKCLQMFSIAKEDIRRAKIHTLIQLLSTSRGQGLRQRWEQPPGMRQRGIIYCRTVDETVNVCREVQAALPTLRVDIYHGKTQKLSREKRDLTYRRFISDEEGENGLDIVVATNAFGMGIDVRRLGFVIHFDVPPTLEAYYQEAGRAGRDPAFQSEKDHAQCILLYHEADLESQRRQIGQNSITQQDIEMVYEALYKLKGTGPQEVLVTVKELQLLSGVDEDKVATCLFYLQYHTLVDGEYVLERRENASQLWQLKFESGYQQRISDPVLHPSSKRLAEVFLTTPVFKLNEEHVVIVDAVDLAAHLNLELNTLDREVNNLVRRNIIAFHSPIFVKWLQNRKDSCAVITQLVKDIRTLLNSADDLRALRNGKDANISVQSLYDKSELSAVSLPIFTHFLSGLALTGAGNRQLFETFKKTTNTSQQEYYKLRLKLSSQPSAVVMNGLINLRDELHRVIERLGYDVLTKEWHYIDLLRETPDYIERQQVSRSLHWLTILGLLTFPEEERRDTVMRVNFLQDVASSDKLEIDLTSLRRVARYGARKLAIMQEYALSTEVQRKQLLLAYFYGEKPLIEPFIPNPTLTDEQRALITLSGGYHLIQGPAGSGKTTLLQEHFRYLVEYLLVPADRILVTAHFRSAVDRMGNQLDYLQSGGRPIPSKTLHKLSEGIFRQNRHLLKRVDGQSYFAEHSGLQVLSGDWKENEARELELISNALDKLYREKGMLDFLPENMERPQLTGSYKLNTSTEEDCLKAITSFRLCGIFPALISNGEDILTALMYKPHIKSWILDKLPFYYAVYISYQFIQGERGVYTFDDQILFALAILRANPDRAKQWQRKYEHIIIDEFQDFTPAAAELVGILSARQKKVMAVGDIRQRILTSPAERGTLADSIELVGNDIPVQEHRLTNNFRSVQEILDFANAVQSYGGYRQRAVRGSRGIQPAIIHVSPPYHLPTLATVREREAAALQNMVDAALHHMRLLPPEDAGSVAFLVASSTLTHPLQLYLESQNQPFALLQNKFQYQSNHVKRILTYFRLIQDSTQTSEVEYFLRKCLSPYFKIKQINLLKIIAQQREQALLETALEHGVIEQIGATEEQFVSLHQHLAVIRKHSLDSTCQEVLRSIREMQIGTDTQVEELAESAEETIERDEAFGELDELKSWTIQKALKHIDSYITFLESNRANRKLVVTTINNAKSQDFDTVFLIGANLLNDRRRWYVSVSRARQRFFCLVDASKGNEVLASVPKGLFEIISWPA